MTRLVPVPVADALTGGSLPLGYEVGVTYDLLGPDGTLARFNSRDLPLGIGVLDDITGLDSAEVRESSEDLTEDDGGVHGTFYFGRRPITLSGSIYTLPLDQRVQRMDRLLRACNAMRRDCELRWSPTGAVPVMVRCRRQQPPRLTGAQGVSKQYQVSLVAADPRIYSQELHSAYIGAAATMQVANQGRADSFPTSVAYGPCTDPKLINFTTGEQINFVGLTVGAGQYLTVDHLRKVVLLNDALNRYAFVDYISTDWWGLRPGFNDVTWQATGTDANTRYLLMWRDAWL